MPAAWRSFTRFDVQCPPRDPPLRVLRGSMFPVFLALNHNSGRRTVCIVVACGGHLRGQPRGALSIVVLQHRTKLEALRGQPRGRVARHNRVAAWRGFTRLYAASQPDFSFPPCSSRAPFWSKKQLKPFKKGLFACPKIVQKKFK